MRVLLLLAQARTPTGSRASKTGPSRDHTLGSAGLATGTYAYAEANMGNRRVDLVLDAGRDLTEATSGVSFWYHMFGAQIGNGEKAELSLFCGRQSCIF